MVLKRGAEGTVTKVTDAKVAVFAQGVDTSSTETKVGGGPGSEGSEGERGGNLQGGVVGSSEEGGAGLPVQPPRGALQERGSCLARPRFLTRAEPPTHALLLLCRRAQC